MTDQHTISWMPLISLAGSIFSTTCTGYFWFVKVRKEQPHLVSFLHDHELFLGNGRGDTRSIGLNVQIIVANNSSLPNAILGVKLSVKLKTGDWQPVTGVGCDKSAPLPLNISPLQTTLLRLTGRLSFASIEECENQRCIESAYSQHHLAQPVEFLAELHTLDDRIKTSHLISEAKTKEEPISLKIAA